MAEDSTPIPTERANTPALDAFWMPFTANRQYKANPRLIVGAQGMYYRSSDDRRVLDGTAGLWCVNAGHGRREIAQAVERQLTTLDYAPTLQMGHPLAFELAQRLAAIAPQGPDGHPLDRVFFANSGSEAADTALKIACAYQRAIGQGSRTRLIGRERGYHGVGFGGITVGGMVNNRRVFPTLPGADHIRDTHDPERNGFARGEPEHGVEFADDLERLVRLHGAETIAAVIVEPVAGSTGVLPPPKGYLQRLREICDRHGILLIFDEVITGFGRLGAPFASDWFGVRPDLVVAAKGLTNGAVPMGAVFASRTVYRGVTEAAGPGQIEFFHGYTYSGHPAACAAALATLDIYERESLFQNAANLASAWEDAIHSLRGLPHVTDIRTIGLMGAVELASRPDAPGRRAYDVFTDCFDHGLLARVTGDTLAFSPPLILEQAHIDELVGVLSGALKRVT